MRIDRPESPDSTPGRLAAARERSLRWFVELGPTGRAVLVVGLLAALFALGVVASNEQAASREWLYPEHRFSSEDAQRIAQRLVRESIAAQAVGGRVEVPAERLSDAYEVVAQANLEPLSARQIRDRPHEFNLLMAPDQVADAALRKQEQELEASLRAIDPALSAMVQIDRVAPRSLTRQGVVRVTVELELDGGRAIPPELVERVGNKVRAWLKPDLLTLMDSRGTILLSPDDPSLSRRTLLQAREDTLRAELLADLSWIEGARVAVLIEPASAAGEESSTTVGAGPGSVAAEPAAAEPKPVIRPNGPIAAADPPPPTPDPPPSSLRPIGTADVTVLVPSRYYQRVARGASGDADPTTETIQTLVSRTEATIRAVVARTVRADELGEVTVDRFFLPPPERPALAPATGVAAVSRLPDWWPAAAGAGLIAGFGLVVAAGNRWRQRGGASSARRSAPATARRARFDVGVAEGAGRSERARALIRQDPAAAAGVLRRWIGQGGPDA